MYLDILCNDYAIKRRCAQLILYQKCIRRLKHGLKIFSWRKEMPQYWLFSYAYWRSFTFVNGNVGMQLLIRLTMSHNRSMSRLSKPHTELPYIRSIVSSVRTLFPFRILGSSQLDNLPYLRAREMDWWSDTLVTRRSFFRHNFSNVCVQPSREAIVHQNLDMALDGVFVVSLL